MPYLDKPFTSFQTLSSTRIPSSLLFFLTLNIPSPGYLIGEFSFILSALCNCSFVPVTIFHTSSSEANTFGSIAMNIWLQPPQLPLSYLSISLVDLPFDKIAAMRSRATDSPEPFQYPVGRILLVSSIWIDVYYFFKANASSYSFGSKSRETVLSFQAER